MQFFMSNYFFQVGIISENMLLENLNYEAFVNSWGFGQKFINLFIVVVATITADI